MTTEYFLATYREMDTEDVLRLTITRDLAQEARDAARIVLLERGVVGDAYERQHADAVKGIIRQTGVTNQCDFCGKTILFGAMADAGQRFCGTNCRDEARLLEASTELAPDLIAEHAMSIFHGACPRCEHRGTPIDYRPSWTIVSLLWFISRERNSVLLCRKCAKTENWWAIGICLLFGWWSIAGLVETPYRIYLNLRGIFSKLVESQPSGMLIYQARLDLAKRLREPLIRIATMVTEKT